MLLHLKHRNNTSFTYLPFFFLLPLTATILTPILIWESGGFPHQQAILQHQLGVLQFNSILSLPGHSVRSHRLRTLSFPSLLLTSGPGHHLCWPVEVPNTPPPSLYSINLPGGLTELRLSHLLDYHLV